MKYLFFGIIIFELSLALYWCNKSKNDYRDLYYEVALFGESHHYFYTDIIAPVEIVQTDNWIFILSKRDTVLRTTKVERFK